MWLSYSVNDQGDQAAVVREVLAVEVLHQNFADLLSVGHAFASASVVAIELSWAKVWQMAPTVAEFFYQLRAFPRELIGRAFGKLLANGL